MERTLKERTAYGTDGTVLPERKYHTAEDLANAAGINKPVGSTELYYRQDKDVLLRYTTAPKYKGITYDGKLVGISSKRGYKHIQIPEALEPVMPLIEPGLLKPLSAGILGDGARIWMSCDIDTGLTENEMSVGPNDRVMPRLLSVFDQTGKGADFHLLTLIRIACENALNAAIRNRDEYVPSVRISHRGKDPVGDAMGTGQVFCNAVDQYKEFIVKARHLSNTEVTRKEASDYIFALYPTDDTKKKDINANKRSLISTLAVRGRGINGNNRGTWWALLNAVTEFIDHHQTYKQTKTNTRNDNRFKSIMFQGSAKKKVTAYEMALERAGV